MTTTQNRLISAPLRPSNIPSLSITNDERTILPEDTHTRVQKLVSGLAARGISVIEWGTLLQRRLKAPVVCVDFSFLIDDDLIEAACQFTEEQGFPPSENNSIFVSCYGRYETIARHFRCPLNQRVNFFPKSFAGFRANELYLAPLILSNDCLEPALVLTAKPAPAMAALVRLISQNKRTDPLNNVLRLDLCMLISYLLFDMSYEGDYAVLEEESVEEVEQQRREAVQQYQTWDGWRDEEMWIADAVQAIIQGNGRYESLPGAP